MQPPNADDLDYMHARFCNPRLGRFMSVDPVGGNFKVPQTWNRYSYAAGNPLKYTDPTGEATAAQLAQEGQEFLDEFEQNATFAVSDGSVFGIYLSWQISNTADGLSAVMDLFKAGDATGTAFGSGAGPGETALAIGQDALRTAGLVAPVVGAGRAVAARGAGAATSELAGVGPGAHAGESIAARSGAKPSRQQSGHKSTPSVLAPDVTPAARRIQAPGLVTSCPIISPPRLSTQREVHRGSILSASTAVAIRDLR